MPAQWADMHAADALTPEARLHRAVVFDALQAAGRWQRRQRTPTVRERAQHRGLVAWLMADGLAARAYRVPFERAMAIGMPDVDAESLRRSLLAMCGVLPRPARMRGFTKVLRRQYVRRPEGAGYERRHAVDPGARAEGPAGGPDGGAGSAQG